eukprot:scaffold2983_cov185-Alexandrium_tamarense.AAC.1
MKLLVFSNNHHQQPSTPTACFSATAVAFLHLITSTQGLFKPSLTNKTTHHVRRSTNLHDTRPLTTSGATDDNVGGGGERRE